MTDLPDPIDAERLALADRIRAHIGTIAPKCSLPVGEWNNIAEDFYEAADQLFAHPAASQGGVPGCGVPGCNDPDCDYGHEPAPSRPAAQPEQGCCMGMAPASQCDCDRVAAQPMREALIEQCAKIAEDQANTWVNGDARTGIGQAYQRACSDVAAKIRAAVAPASANEVEHD